MALPIISIMHCEYFDSLQQCVWPGRRQTFNFLIWRTCQQAPCATRLQPGC